MILRCFTYDKGSEASEYEQVCLIGSPVLWAFLRLSLSNANKRHCLIH